MVKKEVDERICRDCENPIIGRRIDAIVCKNCRDQARRDSSKRSKEKDSEEKLLKKVKGSGVKRHIEREKVEKILEGLKKEFVKNPGISKEEIFNTFQYSPSEIADALELGFGHGINWKQKIEEQDLEAIRDFIEEKMKEEKEKLKEEFEEKMKEPYKMTEYEYSKLKEEASNYKKIISCDPADKGRDHTVILWGIKKDNKFQLLDSYSESKSESTAIVGKIMEIAREFIGNKIKGEIHIDKIGIGVGALSRLKEVIAEKNMENVKVIGCHFGEQAIKKDNFMNKKAENYFRLQALFNEEMIQIIDNRELTRHLLAIKWELSSSEKKKIIDPEDYSPDWADALVYFIWKDTQGLAFAFVSC
jgi:hypothetical protein